MVISEFANSNDIQDYVNMRNLVKVEFDEEFWHYRWVILHFDDGTCISLDLEDCYMLKFWKWTWYSGCMFVRFVNSLEVNYDLKYIDNRFRNFLIDGITLEEQRSIDAWSEKFSNVVRGTNYKNYAHKTILNGVEFVKTEHNKA